MSFRHRPLTDPEATEVVVLAEVFFDKMENQKLETKRKKLTIEEKSMAIGWRQENVSNSEIARCLGCELDEIGFR